jgi:SMC interacting uncharacterized protein involved in chromosome segregation
MWFLSFVPDAWLEWSIHALVLLGLLLGILGAIGKNIPFVSQYGTIVKAIGGLLFVVGVFFEGGYGVEMSYRAKVAEMQDKIEVAQKESKKENIRIQEKVVERVKIIKERADETNREIEAKRDIINAECKLSDDAWVLYNRATQNAISGSAGKSDGKAQ